MTLSPELLNQLLRSACMPELLIVSDYDGTLVPFHVNPALVNLSPEIRVLIKDLSDLSNTKFIVISGRPLSDLKPRFAETGNVMCIGSHGWEFKEIAVADNPESQLMTLVGYIMKEASEKLAGSFIEYKPGARAFHYRSSDQTIAAGVTAQLREKLLALDSGTLLNGKFVIEFSEHQDNKGKAVSKLMTQFPAEGVIFLGDDVTDESVFEFLKAPALTVKVGSGDSAAQYRVDNPSEILTLLKILLQYRKRFLSGDYGSGISDYLFLSDMRTALLLDDRTNLSWMCFPSYDSAPVFHSILDNVSGGEFRITVDDKHPESVAYDQNALMVKYKWQDAGLIDFLDCAEGRPFQRAGRSEFIRVLEGKGTARVVFSPRFDFGRVPLKLSIETNGIKVEGMPFTCKLCAEGWNWSIDNDAGFPVATGIMELENGKAHPMQLKFGSVVMEGLADTNERIRKNADFWKYWLDTLRLPEVSKDLVKNSAMILRGLIYGPNGSILAALTTSLPEAIGQGRNWDYRYCWPRDAALSAIALAKVGAHGPGRRLIDWFLTVLENNTTDFLKPLYTVKGHDVPAEAEIAEVSGYKGSKPVRTGNLAAHQLQLDVLGPIAELLCILTLEGSSATAEYLQLADRMVKMVSEKWKETDSGIWEIRSNPRHYVHSKLMCWHTVNCLIKVAEALGSDCSAWKLLLSEIRDDIESKGYSEKNGTYVCAYELEEADSSLLWLVLTGFHQPDDPRMIRTVAWIEKNLVKDGFIYRYDFNDGLSGSEGAFLICQSWLVEVMCLQKNYSKARLYFDKLLEAVGKYSLLAEQYDPYASIALGNVPQAYSHLGLINSARAIDRLEKS